MPVVRVGDVPAGGHVVVIDVRRIHGVVVEVGRVVFIDRHIARRVHAEVVVLPVPVEVAAALDVRVGRVAVLDDRGCPRGGRGGRWVQAHHHRGGDSGGQYGPPASLAFEHGDS